MSSFMPTPPAHVIGSSHFHDDFDLQRTVATDDTLAYGIATELKRRHVDPSHKSTDHIALISE